MLLEIGKKTNSERKQVNLEIGNTLKFGELDTTACCLIISKIEYMEKYANNMLSIYLPFN